MNAILAALVQEPGGWAEALDTVADAGPQAGTLLLSFTLAIFVVLVFVVRLLLVTTSRPVPVDPFDMARPRDFRTVMVVAAALLAPLAARSFLPVEGLDEGQFFILAYGFQVLIAVALWLLLEAFYRSRARRPG
ncbi:MAG: hypothetical protein M8467_20655 [Anaerolineae bacterium]|nr:hypothetical protein [Anaerolineae bacterium]